MATGDYVNDTNAYVPLGSTTPVGSDGAPLNAPAAPVQSPTPAPMPAQSVPSAPTQSGTQLDPTILALTRAIGQEESQGNYNQVGDNGHSYGAYQWNNPTPLQQGQLPQEWQVDAGKYLGNPNAPMTPANQDQVAYMAVADMAKQGYNPAQIASAWNSGNPNAYKTGGVGYNASQGVKYNVGTYVNNVGKLYNQFYSQLVPTVQAAGTSPTGTTAPSTSQPVGTLQDTGSFLGNLWNSTKNLGSSLVNMAVHPINTLTNLAKIPLGAVEEVGGAPSDTNTQAFDSLVSYFGNRYGGSNPAEIAKNIGKTAYTDPVGFLADLSTALTGVGGAVGAVGDAADAAKAAVASEAPEAAATGAEATATPPAPTPNVVSQAGTALKTAGEATNPFSLAGNAISTVGDVTGISDKLNSIANGITSVAASPDINENAAALSKLGIQPEDVPSSMTNPSPLVNRLETMSAAGAGGETFAQKMQNVSDALENIKSATLEQAGNDQDLTTTGKSIAEGLNETEKTYKAATSAAYDEFQKAAGNPIASVSNTTDLLNKIIDDKNAIGEDAGFFEKKLNVITGGESPNGKMQYDLPTFNTLKALRTDIGEKIGSKFSDPFVAQNVGKLKALYGALTDDMNETVKEKGGEQLSGLLTKAETAYKDSRAALQTGFAKQIRKLADAGQESKIVPTLLKKSTAVEDIPKIKAVIGEENFKQLQYHMLDSIFENAKNLGSDTFKKNGINSIIKAYGEDKMKAILTPQQFDTIKAMQKVITMTNDYEHLGKTAEAGLGLGKLIEGGGAFLAFGKLLTGNVGGFVADMTPILGDQLVSRFVASDTGQTLLREGISGLKKPQIFNSKIAQVGGKIIKAGAHQVYDTGNLPRNVVVERSQNK